MDEKRGTRVTVDYCGGVWEKGRADRGGQQKGDDLPVSRNCFETCLMEGCLSGTHDVIHLIQPGKNVRVQASGSGICEWRGQRAVVIGSASPVGSN